MDCSTPRVRVADRPDTSRSGRIEESPASSKHRYVTRMQELNLGEVDTPIKVQAVYDVAVELEDDEDDEWSEERLMTDQNLQRDLHRMSVAKAGGAPIPNGHVALQPPAVAKPRSAPPPVVAKPRSASPSAPSPSAPSPPARPAASGMASGLREGVTGASSRASKILERAGTVKIAEVGGLAGEMAGKLGGGLNGIAKKMADGKLISDDAFDAAAVLKQIRLRDAAQSWLLDPRSSKFLPWWDGITSAALLYVAIVTPFEVAFLTSSGSIDPLFVINRLLDVIFFCDLIFQFFVAYDAGKNDHASEQWVVDIRHTARHYATTWFVLDFISLLPSIFDILPVANPSYASGAGARGQVSALSGLRAVRILRLLKMVKLVRVSRIITRWQTEHPISFGVLTVLELTVLILFATHWMGCLIGLLASLTGEGDLLMTWYATFGYCFANYGSSAVYPTQRIICLQPFARYFAAVEWGLGLVTGLDPYPAVGPHAPWCTAILMMDPTRNPDCGYSLSTGERQMKLVLLLSGALIWTYVIARLVEVIVSVNPDGKAYRNSIDDLNRFVAIHNLPKPLSSKLRLYMLKSKHIQVVRSYARVYRHLSSGLRGEVALEVNQKWLQQIDLLKDANVRLSTQIAVALQGKVFAPSEFMPAKCLYLMHRGVAMINGSIHGSGRVFGVTSLMYSEDWKESVYIAFGYCEVLTMEGKWLREIAEVCDAATAKRIQRWAVFKALTKHLIANLERKRNLEKRRDPSTKMTLIGALGKSMKSNGSGSTKQSTKSVAGGMPTDELNLSRDMSQLIDSVTNIENMLKQRLQNTKARAETTADVDEAVEAVLGWL